MASHVLVGHRGDVPSGASSVAAAEPQVVRVRRYRHSYAWIVLGLTLAALLSRVYTTNSLAGEPTSDEYLYAVHARDLARDWADGKSVSLDDLSVEGRSVAIESAALTFVLPWDPLTAGRTLQAAFNALCVPMTFVLGRQVGLPHAAAAAGALLLMAIPEFQELAWRFWTDSQATVLALIYLSALVALARRPGPVNVSIALVSLGLLLLTKESAAVTFTPFLGLAVAVPVIRRLSRRGRLVALGASALLAVAVTVVLLRPPADLARSALLQKTFGAGPLVLSSIRDAVPKIPAYSSQLVDLIGPTQLGSGFLWATVVGGVWLVVQTGVALTTARPRWSIWSLGWLVATLVWLPGLVTPMRDLGALGQSDAWVGVAAAGLLVVVGTVSLFLRNSRRTGWGLALLGLVVIAILAERLVISVTPKVSTAALTFRSLMPTVPLLALIAGGGVWASIGALSVLTPTVRMARSGLAVLGAVCLVVFWSPLLRERLSSAPLLGRVADRGADPDTPQGLRVETLVEAQPWLIANVQPGDIILTGIPRQLAWYADLGVDGTDMLVDLGSQPRTPEEQRQYILDRVDANGVGYVIDFNVNWLDPGGDLAREWRQTYATLAARPNIETAYLKRDKFGNPVFYVLRNHGYATAPAQ